MSTFLINSANHLSRISQFTGSSISWLTLLMVVFLTLNILGSWLFNSSSILLSESITWMHSANFLLAAAYTLNSNEHVRVDIFYCKLSERGKAYVDLFGTVFLLIPVSVFIIWASWSYVLLSWRLAEVSAEPGGLPAIFVLKGLLLLMPVLLIIEGITQMLIAINIIIKKPDINKTNIKAPQVGRATPVAGDR